MENIWFTADEHFGHKNIIDFCHRPFKDTDEMRETLIDNHNKVVMKGDRVYHIGDMFWRTTGAEEALSIIHRLNGQHYYVYGNHEEVFRNANLRNAFVWCKDIENLKVAGYPNIVLCHYAMRVWNGSHCLAWQLYGHTHAALPEDSSLSFDVGVDAQNYFPISIDQVTKRMEEKAKKFRSKIWSCPSCANAFNATDTTPKLCSKCLTEMKLI